MKINTVLTELNIGASNIDIEGEVTYVMLPRNVKGDNEKGHYDFWSQFVVIQDQTGKIGCGVNIEKEEYKLIKGTKARIKGKLSEYKNKKGEMVKKIDGKLIGISDRDKETDVELTAEVEEYFEEKAKEEKVVEKPVDKVEMKTSTNDIWEAKDLRIARECAVKAVTDLAVAKIIEGKEFFPFADTIVKYIYNGYKEKDDSGKKKSILHDNREPLEVISDEPLFPDEEIADENIPGSSPDKAIPWGGKRKTIKPVSRAEDYIAPEDMPE